MKTETVVKRRSAAADVGIGWEKTKAGPDAKEALLKELERVRAKVAPGRQVVPKAAL